MKAKRLPPEKGLRLRAEDAEDLAVISACLQDALVAVRDLAYDPEARSFVFVANRFRWEGGGTGKGETPRFERILCGVAFNEVDGIVYRGFQRNEEDCILSLLAIRPEIAANGGTIQLDFSGSAAIRLAAPAIRCRVRDLGEPWPTHRYPEHPDEAK